MGGCRATAKLYLKSISHRESSMARCVSGVSVLLVALASVTIYGIEPVRLRRECAEERRAIANLESMLAKLAEVSHSSVHDLAKPGFKLEHSKGGLAKTVRGTGATGYLQRLLDPQGTSTLRL